LSGLTFGKVVRRSLLYLGLAFAGLIIAALLVVLTVYTGVDPQSTSHGIFLAIWTGFLLWWVIKSYRSLWKRVSFWVIISALLSVHLVAWLIVLRSYPHWPPLWFVPSVVIEGLLFGMFLDTIFKIKTQNDSD